MYPLTSLIRPGLAAALLLLAGCAGLGLPGMLGSQPALTADSPLAKVVLPELVLGRDGKADPVLQPNAKPDAFKESADLQSFCSPGALSRFGNGFIGANDSQAFDEAMVQGTDVAKRRHAWNFEAVRANKQADLLNAFLKGRGGANLTPERLNALRMEEEAYQRWNAKVDATRQTTKDGNLTPAQQRQLQNEFPHFRMGRTDMHLVPSALDGVNRNQAILQARDAVLRADEARYVDRLNAVYKRAAQQQLAVPPSSVPLAQLARFDVFRSYSVQACLGRVASAQKPDAALEAIEANYQTYARSVVLPQLPQAYKGLATASSPDGLQQALAEQFPTPYLNTVALSEPEFAKKLKGLRAALLQKEAAAQAANRRKEAELMAAAQKRQRDAFRQKAAKGVVPSKDEILQVWVDTIFANTQARRTNFANKFVRDDVDSFSEHVNAIFAVVKTSSAQFRISNLACTPSAGKLACTWSSTRTFTDYGFINDKVYSTSDQEKEDFAWTDDGLKCVSSCSSYIVLVSSSRGSGGGSGSGGYRGDKDADNMREWGNDRQRAREEANDARQRAYEADQEARRAASRGRCRMGDICN